MKKGVRFCRIGNMHAWESHHLPRSLSQTSLGHSPIAPFGHETNLVSSPHILAGSSRHQVGVYDSREPDRRSAPYSRLPQHLASPPFVADYHRASEVQGVRQAAAYLSLLLLTRQQLGVPWQTLINRKPRPTHTKFFISPPTRINWLRK